MSSFDPIIRKRSALQAEMKSEWRIIMAHIGITASVVLVSAFILTGFDTMLSWAG